MPSKLNLTGQRFGRVTVIGEAKNEGQRTAWRCRCDCGTEVTKTTNALRSSDASSCGCGRISPMLDLLGKRFGRLTVIGEVGRNRRQDVLWLCRCDCGDESAKPASDLSRGRIRSCGCFQRDEAARRSTRHGLNDEPLHRRWLNMIDRTTNPNHKSFHHYGGRGIKVCASWRSYETFAGDMGRSFSVELTLDRIDVNGDYEPGNCRWITNAEQQRNRRSNRMITWRGTQLILVEWGELLGVNPKVIENRLSRGWSLDRALTTGASPESLASLPNDQITPT